MVRIRGIPGSRIIRESSTGEVTSKSVVSSDDAEVVLEIVDILN